MRVFWYIFYVIILFTTCLSTSRAEQRDSTLTQKFSIHYKVDSTNINPNYIKNRRQIENILYYLHNSPRIDSITIYAWASPEGGYKYNRWLSKERARSAKEFLLKHSPDTIRLNADKIKISPLAENWEGLTRFVETKYFQEDRHSALDILNDRNISDEARKYRLKKLDQGRTWRYFIKNYMPELRAATWICTWAPAPPRLPFGPGIKDSLTAPSNMGILLPYRPVPIVYHKTRTILAMKSNLLYDAGTALNFAVEVPFNEHLSFLYEHHCPWWLTKNNRYCLQYLSLGGELRWWFVPKTQKESKRYKQRDALVGHFLGLNAMCGKADLQANRDLCYQFEFMSAGLTYGYAFPISRYLNLELSLSAGYARIPYQHYIPTEDWQILIRDKNNAGTLHYFGPTKAEVSLVIPIRATTTKIRKYE